MTDLIISSDTSQTMTSLEIAETTGKRHGDVIRDIRNILEALGDDADLRHLGEERDSRGYTSLFRLDQDLTLTLASGYSAKLRYALVKRWRELEAANQPPALDTTPRHSVLDMWKKLGGSTLPKPLRVQLELMLRACPAAIEKDSSAKDYLVATFLALGVLETLAQHREEKLSLPRGGGLETSDALWQSFAVARETIRDQLRSMEGGVSGLLH